MSDSKNILINILTRTSNRPAGFRLCRQSIVNQTYKNIKHFVSYEDEKSLEYINDQEIIKIKVEKEKKGLIKNEKGYLYAPYNLYLNKLISNIKEGWILFLDDDDNLFHNKVIEEVVKEIQKGDEDTIYIWQMRYPNGLVLPPNDSFKT